MQLALGWDWELLLISGFRCCAGQADRQFVSYSRHIGIVEDGLVQCEETQP